MSKDKILRLGIWILGLIFIIGSVFWWKIQKETTIISGCLPQNTKGGCDSSQKYDNTSTWKMYTNNQYGYGFEFRYPPDFKYQSQYGNIALTNDASSIVISVHTDGSDDFFQSLYGPMCGPGSNDFVGCKPKNEKIGRFLLKDINAYLRDDIEPPKLHYYLQNPNKTNSLEFYTDEKNQSLVNEILSTFKFIPTVTSTSDTSIPPLFSGATWTETILGANSFLLSYDNYNYIQKSPTNIRQSINIQLPGHLWISTVSLPDQSRDAIRQFQKYYNDFLKNSGWVGSQELPSKFMTIDAPAADGSTGSVWGYVKVKNNKLKSVGLQYEYIHFTNTSTDGPIEITCPCSVRLYVYVSEEVDVNTLTFK